MIFVTIGTGVKKMKNIRLLGGASGPKVLVRIPSLPEREVMI